MDRSISPSSPNLSSSLLARHANLFPFPRSLAQRVGGSRQHRVVQRDETQDSIHAAGGERLPDGRQRRGFDDHGRGSHRTDPRPAPARFAILGVDHDDLGASVAFLGVFFAVPLRRHFLLESQLRFPSGTATAETIKSMFADARRAKSQVGTLIHAAAFAAGTVVLTWCFPWVLRPPVFATIGPRPRRGGVGGYESTRRSLGAGYSWGRGSA